MCGLVLVLFGSTVVVMTGVFVSFGLFHDDDLDEGATVGKVLKEDDDKCCVLVSDELQDCVSRCSKYVVCLHHTWS